MASVQVTQASVDSDAPAVTALGPSEFGLATVSRDL